MNILVSKVFATIAAVAQLKILVCKSNPNLNNCLCSLLLYVYFSDMNSASVVDMYDGELWNASDSKISCNC